MNRIVLFSLLTAIGFFTKAQNLGNAVFLNGVSDYIEVPDHPDLNQQNTISVEAWIKPCNVDGDNFIISKHWCGGTQNAYNLSVLNGLLKWNWDNNGCGNQSNNFVSNDTLIEVGQWYHVAAVHTTTGVSLYVNGLQVPGSLTLGAYGTIQNSNEPLRIGVYRFLGGGFGANFHGSIDEVRVWDYALNSNEIANRFNVELLGNESGLVSYQNMNITGSGAGILVPNSASSTGSLLDGITIGTGTTPSFGQSFQPIFGNDTVLCPGETLLLNPGIQGNYIWQDSSQGASFLVNQAGQYYVEISDFCQNYRDTINVSYQIEASYNLGIDTIVCIGDSLVLGEILMVDSLVWQDGSTSPNMVVSTSDTYWYTAISCGVAFSDTIVITVNAPPSISSNSPIYANYNELVSLEVNGGNNWSWSPAGNLSCDDCSNPIYIATDNQVFVVSASNQGCVAYDTIEVFLNDLTFCYKIGDAFSPNADGLNETFFPILSNIDFLKTFHIYNRWGELIHMNLSPWDGKYKGEAQETGNYTYYLEIDCLGEVFKISGQVTLIR